MCFARTATSSCGHAIGHVAPCKNGHEGIACWTRRKTTAQEQPCIVCRLAYLEAKLKTASESSLDDDSGLDGNVKLNAKLLKSFKSGPAIRSLARLTTESEQKYQQQKLRTYVQEAFSRGFREGTDFGDSVGFIDGHAKALESFRETGSVPERAVEEDDEAIYGWDDGFTSEKAGKDLVRQFEDEGLLERLNLNADVEEDDDDDDKSEGTETDRRRNAAVMIEEPTRVLHNLFPPGALLEIREDA